MGLAIKKGDKVIVIAGKGKGKTGKILRISAKTKRVIVDNVNLVKNMFVVVLKMKLEE